jgi:hypothetical protein
MDQLCAEIVRVLLASAGILEQMLEQFEYVHEMYEERREGLRHARTVDDLVAYAGEDFIVEVQDDGLSVRFSHRVDLFEENTPPPAPPPVVDLSEVSTDSEEEEPPSMAVDAVHDFPRHTTRSMVRSSQRPVFTASRSVRRRLDYTHLERSRDPVTGRFRTTEDSEGETALVTPTTNASSVLISVAGPSESPDLFVYE